MAKILIIEDNAPALELLIDMLTPQGYEIEGVNKKIAIAKFKDKEFDLVILNLRLPDMDGVGFVRELKEANHKNSPVIIIVPYRDIEERIKALELSDYYYLIKPPRADELRLLVRSVLEVKAKKEIKNIIEERVKPLILAIDAKDLNTFGHSERVRNLSLKIAQRLELPNEEYDKYNLLAFMHDISRIGITTRIFDEQNGFNKDINEAIRIGLEIIKLICHLHRVEIEIGHFYQVYVNGKKHQKVEITDIIAVSDLFDLLTHNTMQREALSEKEAINFLTDDKFNHKVVEALTQVI